MNLQGALTLPDGTVQEVEAAIRPGEPPSWSRFAVGEQATLGVHVYARDQGDLVLGTLRVSNGAVFADGTGFCGGVYFNRLEFRAPPGFRIFTLPQASEAVEVRDGETWWTIASKPGIGSHFFRPRAILERPFALVRAESSPAEAPNAAEARARAALEMRWVEIPSPVHGYGPTDSRQPTVDRKKLERAWLPLSGELLDAQARGAKFAHDNLAQFERTFMGPWWLDGPPPAWMHGGFGIDPSHGFEQCPAAVLAHAILHRASVARQYCACYHADTGRPITLREWTAPPHRDLLFGEPGLEGRVELVCFTDGPYEKRRYRRFNQGVCDYERSGSEIVDGKPVRAPCLWDYEGHDVAHGIRAMRHAIVLAEYADDRAAKDDLWMMAEDWRYRDWSDRTDEKTAEGYPGEWIPITLTRTLAELETNQHRGGLSDRAYGWMAYAGAAAIKYAVDEAVRSDWKGWGANMLAAALLAADKLGFTMREHRPGEMPANVRGIITFHEGLIAVGTFALEQQVHGRIRPAVAELLQLKCRSAYTVLKPRPYGDTLGPPHFLGTEVDGKDLEQPLETYAYGTGDPAHVLAACALAFRATGDPKCLEWALKHWIPHKTLRARYNWLQGLQEKSWGAEMQAALEEHGVGGRRPFEVRPSEDRPPEDDEDH